MPLVPAFPRCGSVAQIRAGWQASARFPAPVHGYGAVHCNAVIFGAPPPGKNLPELSPKSYKFMKTRFFPKLAQALLKASVKTRAGWNLAGRPERLRVRQR